MVANECRMVPVGFPGWFLVWPSSGFLAMNWQRIAAKRLGTIKDMQHQRKLLHERLCSELRVQLDIALHGRGIPIPQDQTAKLAEMVGRRVIHMLE